MCSNASTPAQWGSTRAPDSIGPSSPHFYMNLFPYSYSAGLACGYGVVTAIRKEGQPAIDRWLNMLTLGTTLPPLELAQRGGRGYA